MPILAGQLVQDQQLVSVASNESLSRAPSLMIEHDFSQLPVIDHEGKPLGIVTCGSISKALLHLGARVDELSVDHALVKLSAHPEEEDLLYLLDTILKASAVFVVDANDKLVGIITEHDTTQYFRQRAEDLVLVNDIEDALKRHLQISYDSQSKESLSLRDAIDGLSNSLDGIRKKSHSSLKSLCKTKDIKPTQDELDAIVDKHFPLREEARAFTDLTLSEFIQLAQKNWAKLEPVFGLSQSSWTKMMEDIRLIRNKLFHFKGDTSAVERNKLQFCANWYVNHSPITVEEAQVVIPISDASADETTSQEASNQESKIPTRANEPSPHELVEDKYRPLVEILGNNLKSNSVGTQVQIHIDHINDIIHKGLPKAAREQISWWTRPATYSRQWIREGWKAVAIDSGWITFERQEIPTRASLINFAKPWDISYWCAVLRCSEERLRDAVYAVGTHPNNVEKYIKNQDTSMSYAMAM